MWYPLRTDNQALTGLSGGPIVRSDLANHLGKPQLDIFGVQAAAQRHQTEIN
jgi:hypothetical protein